MEKQHQKSTDNLECKAPYFAYNRAGTVTYVVAHGCCDRWTCPRCGEQVARQHYARIVYGAETLAETQQLYFLTLTCRGRELDRADAVRNYYEWTNKFLDAARRHAQRRSAAWCYVQVTENQKRGHPHSHFLTTFAPSDLVESGGRLRSDWLLSQVKRSGLGEQYDISLVQNAAAASRYVAKYMFKPSMFSAAFPARWKRVRYSRNWPSIDAPENNAFVLVTPDDWLKLADLAVVVEPKDHDSAEACRVNLAGSSVVINNKLIT
jgi:hypothetical protein